MSPTSKPEREVPVCENCGAFVPNIIPCFSTSIVCEECWDKLTPEQLKQLEGAHDQS